MSVMVPQIQIYETFVNVLPSQHREKARSILKKTMPVLDINDRIFYRDGTLGSNLLDILNYYFSPDLFDRPPDFSRFLMRANETGKKWLHLKEHD
jgi:hypothetical protein